jgi:hypothetical protein
VCCPKKIDPLYIFDPASIMATAQSAVPTTNTCSNKRKLPLLPSPYTYERVYSSYKRQWDEYKESFPRHVEVTDLAWYENEEEDARYLLGCTSRGQIAVWRLPQPNNDNQDAIDSINTSPVARVQVSSKPLTSIQKFGEKKDSILVAGDEGITTVKVKDILQSADLTSDMVWWNKSSSNPIQQAKIYNGNVFGVSPSGDAYKFDLNTSDLVSSYKIPSGEIFTSSVMGLVQPSASSTNSPLLLVGGNRSSTVSIWDVAKDRGMESLQLSLSEQKTKKKSYFVFGKSQSSAQSNVTSIHISEHWWTFAGGQHAHQPLEGGFMSTYHGPTRSMVACTQTRECIQQVASHDNGLVTVGNEGVVSFWDSAYSLQRTHRVWSSPPSGRAIAISRSSINTILAIGGVGPKVDLLEEYCKIQTLTL